MGKEPVSAVLVINPRNDVAFVDDTRALHESGVTTPAALEGRLRETYPSVIVRARELTGEPYVTWYVYRDGHWVDSRQEG
jgi:hypothetical protein